MTRRTAIAAMVSTVATGTTPRLKWNDLPDLPQPLGGQFAGSAGESVIVAGGSYFDTPPWNGGTKQRVDTAYALTSKGDHWTLAGRLPHAVAAGASVSIGDGLLCTGGQFGDGSSQSCLLLRIRNERLLIEPWPDLPHTLSMHAMASDGQHVYIAGGQQTTQSTQALRSFWRLPITGSSRHWEQLPDLPVAGRILPILLANPDAIYLISGAELTGTAGPPPGRRFLADAWRYHPNHGWQQIAAPPKPVQGGSGLAHNGKLFVFSGNDGAFAAREYELRERHPGFSKDVLCYHPNTDHWAVAGTMPVGLVTTAVARWRDQYVLPGGEVRPAFRSARVIACHIDE